MMRRLRHTLTFRYRLVCDDCGWVSGEFLSDDDADTAASAHAEAVHGVTVS